MPTERTRMLKACNKSISIVHTELVSKSKSVLVPSNTRGLEKISSLFPKNLFCTSMQVGCKLSSFVESGQHFGTFLQKPEKMSSCSERLWSHGATTLVNTVTVSLSLFSIITKENFSLALKRDYKSSEISFRTIFYFFEIKVGIHYLGTQGEAPGCTQSENHFILLDGWDVLSIIASRKRSSWKKLSQSFRIGKMLFFIQAFTQ